jgi:hypothetical protein
MIRPFTPFEETCVDKETAKGVAQGLAPAVRTAQTLALLPLRSQTKPEEVEDFLRPYWGKACLAKPTNGSGGVLFLNRPDAAGQTVELLRCAKRNYFFKRFEAQYLRLSPKILVEESLGNPPPVDFRFYASRGKLFFCIYDEVTSLGRRLALFTVPDYSPIPVPTDHPLPDPLPRKPPHWDLLLDSASKLSKPFDFVRVDLYDRPEGVYFGEFTLTPNASELPFRDRAFSRQCLLDLLVGLRSPAERL